MSEDDLMDFNLSLLKKKKKKKPLEFKETGNSNEIESRYLSRLEALFEKLPRKEKHKISFIRPMIQKLGSRKIVWTNFSSIVRLLNREEDHIKNFVLNELATDGSINAKGHLIIGISGRQDYAKHIETIMKKYYTIYMICNECKQMDTEIEHNSSMRVDLLKCNFCFSTKVLSKN